jgi:UDP-N-acetylglucosamine diphosphorylase / glucose-1-phosphate thymidylyltransferase / UDP-N-acetylgalactosamine diphosphorylase / glucosamine-1-phosphate N-acetyltransferase / galactosamine-1-phosphate N-acetyltransferase
MGLNRAARSAGNKPDTSPAVTEKAKPIAAARHERMVSERPNAAVACVARMSAVEFLIPNRRALSYAAVMFKPADLFDLSQTEHAALFEGCEYAWDALKKIQAYLLASLRPGLHNRCEGVAYVGERVFIGEGTVVEDGVMIKGPAIIGRNCQLRHNAYIREQVIVGDDCVVGNSCELKNALLFNKAAVPHFNYVGDSILGYKAHAGAGVIFSNVKSLPGNVMVEVNGKRFDTGLRKFGALLGDDAEVGCNSVLNPGSIIGRGAVIYPSTNWRGVLGANMIAKNKAAVEIVARRR